MKITKHKNILGLLYGLLLLIPFASVLVRTAYVALNKNANQSWSGTTYKELQPIYYESNDVETYNDLIIGNIYNWTDNYNTLSTSTTVVLNIGLSEDTFRYLLPNLNYDNGYTFTINIVNNNTNIFLAYYLNDTYINVIQIQNTVFWFINLGINNLNHIDKLLPHIEKCNVQIIKEYIEVEQDLTLDNAFEYSLKEITNNDIGKVKFFTWFADMFLDVNDGTSAIYIGFINWYFNYALLMSLGYVLFGVLMWFINWVRRMIEKGQDFGQGGF